ncbi:MAG TPA: four-carbon acid sugar kinase family protein [Armatimonadota bacterium]|jgi:uncharacterized protein YgbK (DUF1537 family)
MPDLLLLADDLTGACDAAAPFAARGARTNVLLSPRLPADTLYSAEILSLDLNYRDCRPKDAEGRLAEVLRVVSQAGTGRLYLKVDSLLRGHVALALRLALRELDISSLLLCPAFPANGRGFSGGRAVHSVTQAPLDDGGLRHLLQVAGLPVRHITLSTLRQGGLAEAIQAAGGIAMVDALTDEDLDRVAEASAAVGPGCLPVGSGGLSSALARRWPLRTALPRLEAVESVLAIVGTAHPETLAQVEHWVARGAERWEWAEGTEYVPKQETRAVPHAVVQLRMPGATRSPEGWHALCSQFGAYAARWAVDLGASGVILTGGATARAFLEGAGALCPCAREDGGLPQLHLQGEVLPGMPRASVLGGPLDGLQVVAKSGGFGDPAALEVLARALRQTGLG